MAELKNCFRGQQSRGKLEQLMVRSTINILGLAGSLSRGSGRSLWQLQFKCPTVGVSSPANRWPPKRDLGRQSHRTRTVSGTRGNAPGRVVRAAAAWTNSSAQWPILWELLCATTNLNAVKNFSQLAADRLLRPPFRLRRAANQ